jgi:hypothetical protein
VRRGPVNTTDSAAHAGASRSAVPQVLAEKYLRDGSIELWMDEAHAATVVNVRVLPVIWLRGEIWTPAWWPSLEIP